MSNGSSTGKRFRQSLLALALALVSLPAVAADSAEPGAAKAPPAAPAKPAPARPAKKGAPTASTTQTTLKGELTCAKCGLHEAAACQNVLRVKDAGGQETKYYLEKNAVAESHHDKVCGGSSPATVTGTVAEQGGKKVLTATSVKFD